MVVMNPPKCTTNMTTFMVVCDQRHRASIRCTEAARVLPADDNPPVT